MSIENNIKKEIITHYKGVHVEFVQISDDYLMMKVYTQMHKYPFIAKRILDKYKEIRAVHFTGALEDFYTRETLRWVGYKMK